MAKRGRKRKAGKREPNGRIERARGEDPNLVAARMPHRSQAVVYSFPDGRIISRHIPLDQVISEKAESPIGRYVLVGAISEKQYQAAIRIRHSHALAKKAIGAKRMRESIAGFAQPGSTSVAMSDEKATECVKDYFEAMDYAGPRKVQNVLINCIFYEWDLMPKAVLDLQKGLFRLVKYYGLT